MITQLQVNKMSLKLKFWEQGVGNSQQSTGNRNVVLVLIAHSFPLSPFNDGDGGGVWLVLWLVGD